MCDDTTIAKIAAALKVHRTSVMRRAEKESWEFTEDVVRGGMCRKYSVISLPDDVQVALKNYSRFADAAEAELFIENTSRAVGLTYKGLSEENSHVDYDAKLSVAAAKLEILSRWSTLTQNQIARILSRLEIIKAFQAWIFNKKIPYGEKSLDVFAAQYVETGGAAVSHETRVIIKKISGRNLRRWIDGLTGRGLAGLVDEKNGSAVTGHGKIDDQPEMKALVVGMLVEKPHIRTAYILEAIRARFGVRLAPPSYTLKKALANDLMGCPDISTIRRWRAKWVKENAGVYLSVRNPDAWKNQQMLAFGDASEDVTHPNYRWEMDSTPADVLLVDPDSASGVARYSILGVIDVYTRRGKLLVSKTSKSSMIGSLVRRTVMDWGRVEHVKHDRGADYCANFLQVFFSAIGTETEPCQPFSGWQKPHIERFFRTFNHGLAELLPGYIGHNVAERKELEARASFGERLFDKGGVLEVRMTAEELQDFCDDWCENVYHQNPHEGLNGKTPTQMAAEWPKPIERIDNERALDILLAPLAGSNARGHFSLQKKGIRINRYDYIAPELGAYSVGDRFTVRQDVADAGRVFVFDDKGEFVCVAISPELTGISPKEIAAAAKAIQNRVTREEKAILKQTARKSRAKDIVEEILRDRATRSGQLATLPPRGPAHSTPAIAAAARAAAADGQKTVSGGQAIILGQPLSQQPATVTRLPEKPRSRLDMSVEEVYQQWLEIGAKLSAGEPVAEMDRRFHIKWPGSGQGSAWLKRIKAQETT